MSFEGNAKRITAILCALALSATLASCRRPGGSEDGTSSSSASDGSGAATAPWMPETTVPETVDMSGREALVKPSAASAALKYTGGELEFMPDETVTPSLPLRALSTALT